MERPEVTDDDGPEVEAGLAQKRTDGIPSQQHQQAASRLRTTVSIHSHDKSCCESPVSKDQLASEEMTSLDKLDSFHSVSRKHSRPRMSKLFVKEYFQTALNPTDEIQNEKSEDESAERTEDANYTRVAEINTILKKMKVDKFRPRKHHSVTMDPNSLQEADDTIFHPFRLLRQKKLSVELASSYPAGTKHLPSEQNPELAMAVKMVRRLTPLSMSVPHIITDQPESPGHGKHDTRPTTCELLNKDSILSSFSLSHHRDFGHGHTHMSDSYRTENTLSLAEMFERQRSLKDEEEYQLFHKFSIYKQKRRSVVCRSKWKKAANIIQVIHRFSKSIAISSLQKDAHMKTFAVIGDEATKETEKNKLSLFDSDFSFKKADPGELRLSTRVQVLMRHSPDSRTTDEVTLILCDLQCYPSFCSYPLAIQTKIARCGMFMPVEKKRVLLRQGHEAQNWYFVLSGQAIETETVKEEDGSETYNTVKFVTQGMTLGEEAILNRERQQSTVTTRKNMQLVCLDKEYFYEVFRQMGEKSSDIPDHVLYLKQMPFMVYFPFDVLLKHPTMCYQYYCRPNTILVRDSKLSEWIYVVRSGTCVIQMYIGSTKASWRDMQLALAHPQINIDGQPLPETDTGPGKLAPRKKAYTLFQRMSAHDLEASDLKQVPALHMTSSSTRNVRHGLHLLTGGVNRMKCPWPLDFFDAINRTAFTITLPSKHFPIQPDRDSVLLTVPSPEHSSSNYADHKKTQMKLTYQDFKQQREQRFVKLPDIDSRDGGGRSDSTSVHNRNNNIFLTAMEGTDPSRSDSGLQHTVSGQVPHIEVNADINQDDDPGDITSTKASKRKSVSIKIHEDKAKISGKAVPKRPLKPSVTRRRKQYVVPEQCRPPVSGKSWKRRSAPYECLSPPVYVEIDVLTEGDYFGLDELQEPGWESRDHSGKLALISRGAEVVMLNKRFFMSFADDKTHLAIRDCMHVYPSTESVQTRYRLQLAWRLYSQKVQDEFYTDLQHQGKTMQGTYFQTSTINMGDPYKVLKEL